MIDLTDKKIIIALANNARLSYTRLGKQVRISREVAKYRVEKLKKAGIIRDFISIINTAKLGYSTHHFYIRLLKCNRKKEEEIIKYIASLPMVTFIGISTGKCDLIVECYARNILELNDMLRNINKSFIGRIKKIEQNAIIQEFACMPKYLLTKVEITQDIKVKRFSEEKTSDLDLADLKILKKLSKNARSTAVDIAPEIKLSADTVHYRIKNLIKNKLIKGYKTVIDHSKLGYHRYVIMLQLMDVTLADEKKIISFLRHHQNVLYVMKTMGSCNIVIDIAAETPEKFREVLMEIRDVFSKFIQDYDVVTLFDEYKNEYFPEGIKIE